MKQLRGKIERKQEENPLEFMPETIKGNIYFYYTLQNVPFILYMYIQENELRKKYIG